MAKDENTTEYLCTRITPNMVVNGDISSSDNLLIEGQVFGNIDTSADVTANNLIVGNVKAGSVALNSARIKGDLEMDGALAIGDSTIVIGNVAADALKIAGKVRGDINVKESALLTETALIVGDITAAFVTTQSGARINGSITTTSARSEVDLDTEFDLGDIENPGESAADTFTEIKPNISVEAVVDETEGGDF